MSFRCQIENEKLRDWFGNYMYVLFSIIISRFSEKFQPGSQKLLFRFYLLISFTYEIKILSPVEIYIKYMWYWRETQFLHVAVWNEKEEGSLPVCEKTLCWISYLS